MSFLVLLMAVWVEKFSSLRRSVQRDRQWLRALHRCEASPSRQREPWLCLLALVVLPAALLTLILVLLQPFIYGWLVLPIHLLVLVYSFGRGDLRQALGPFRDAWRRADMPAALHVAQRDIGLTASDGEAVFQRVQGQLLWQTYQGFFAVIFYYFLAGPPLALAYRLLALTAEHAQQPLLRERAEQVRAVLDWVPVRLLAASFALVGNFSAVMRVLLPEVLNFNISAARLIGEVGSVAGEVPAPVIGEAGLAGLDDLWQLLLRAATLWYCGFALGTLLL